LAQLLQGRKFEFDVERAVFLTVLHRLFASGSDRAAEVWRQRYAIRGVETLQLHHLYRAMAWLGEPLAEDQQAGATSLVGNKGYRKFLRTRPGGGFEIDATKIANDARFDGKWVLQTDTELTATDCALKYKELWMVEHLFRSLKSILETRPIYHKCDETIRGHVFCSFLALLLLKELLARIEARGWHVEWQRLRDDLDGLEEISVQTNGRAFVIRSQTEGDAGKAIQAAGIALGSAVRLLDSDASPKTSPTEDRCSAKAKT